MSVRRHGHVELEGEQLPACPGIGWVDRGVGDGVRGAVIVGGLREKRLGLGVGVGVRGAVIVEGTGERRSRANDVILMLTDK